MASPDDLTGQILVGEYRLSRLIRTGMGTVYEATKLSTGERCAVKILSSELAADAEVVKRFFVEARAIELVKSDNVVASFDSGLDEASRPYYVMEYLTGEDLGDTLARVGALNQAASIKILFQAATGLAGAHAHGIVHRDVKPSNLFLVTGDDGSVRVKVLDFGIAKVKMEVLGDTLSSVTRTGSLLGTPYYMSPEQIKRASTIDASADVWSLGIVLYECLTGRLPWGMAETFGELLAAVLTDEVGSVQDRAPWVRPELADLVRRATSRDRVGRFASALEFLEALRPLLPDDGRLLAHEIAAPAEAERSSLAPRFSFADTVRLSATPVPPSPAIEPIILPSRRRTRWAIGFTAGVILPIVGFSVVRIAMPSLMSGGPASGAEPSKTQLDLAPQRTAALAKVEQPATVRPTLESPSPIPSSPTPRLRVPVPKKRPMPPPVQSSEAKSPAPARSAPAANSAELPSLSGDFE